MVLAGVLAGVLVLEEAAEDDEALTGDFLAGATDFLFFISSFIIGVGLARLSSASSSPSVTAARLSARSLLGPRQLVTDWLTSDTELRSAFLDLLAGVLTSLLLGRTAMDLLVCFLALPLTSEVSWLPRHLHALLNVGQGNKPQGHLTVHTYVYSSPFELHDAGATQCTSGFARS